MKAALAFLSSLAATAALAQGAPSVNESTGDLGYSYEFKLPKARGRYQPSLALVYSSAATQDIGYGSGWSLTTSYIELDTRGSPDKPTRWLVNGLDRKLLVLAGSKYRAEVEDSFFEVTAFSTGTYLAVDANGTQYTFDRRLGQRAYLTKVEDIDGNIVSLDYSVDINGVPLAEDPVAISYNNFGIGPMFVVRVQLEFEEGTNLTPAGTLPPQMGAVAGYMFDRRRRLNRIRVLRKTGPEYTPTYTTRSYQIEYTPRGPAGDTSLSAITEYGGDFAYALPSTTFVYDFNDYALEPKVSVAAPDLSAWPGLYYVLTDPIQMDGIRGDWIDLDGDGRTDLVWKMVSGGAQQGVWWARNTTAVGSSAVTFAPASQVPWSAFSQAVGLMDFNADGVMDAWVSRVDASGRHYLDVYRGGIANGQMGFWSTPITIDITEASPTTPSETRLTAWADINGDGVPDYGLADKSLCTASQCTWTYWLTKFDPSGWGASATIKQPGQLFQLPGARTFFEQNLLSPAQTAWLAIDLNGDGLPDDVWNTRSFPDMVNTYIYNATNSWAAWLNPGTPYSNAAWAAVAWGSSQAFGYGDSDTLQFDDIYCSTERVEDTRFVHADLVDLNGDGRPDLVGSRGIVWNTGRGFSGAAQQLNNSPGWARLSDAVGAQGTPKPGHSEELCEYAAYSQFNNGQFADVNGDGIPDFVRAVTVNQVTTYEVFRGINSNRISRPVLLRRVTTSSGATYDVDYVTSAVFGAPARARKPVVTALTTSGYYVPSSVNYYWYANPASNGAWYDPVKQDDRGFQESWSQDATTKMVRHTRWATGSHALVGRAESVETGTAALGIPASSAVQSDPTSGPTRGSPPVIAAPALFSTEEFHWAARNLLDGAYGNGGGRQCPITSEPTPANYPLRVVGTSHSMTTFHDGSAATVTTTVACIDVDIYGNILKSTATPSLNGVNGVALTTSRTFVGATQCKGIPSELHVIQSDGSTNVSEVINKFDWNCHLVEEYSPGTNTPLTNRKTYAYTGPFNQLSSSTTGGVTTGLTYDPTFGLYVTAEKTSDGVTATQMSYVYDLATGLRTSFVGPTVVWKDGSAYTSPYPSVARYFAYDSLGRTLAVSKSPITWPTVTAAVEAYEYRDWAVPRATIAYRFSVPQTFALTGPIPQADDAAKTITYFDGLGRALQVRERVGGGGTAAAAARVVDYAQGYRVAKADLYDAAGRVWASLSPAFEDGDGFVDYRSATGLQRRATITGFDERSRPTCVSLQYIGNALAEPAAGAPCTSDSSGTQAFRLATQIKYTSRAIAGRGPWGLFIAQETIPPEVNSTGGTTPKVSLFGAMGEELGSIDGDGNRTWIERDVLGRETLSWRESGSGAPATPKPVSTITYNQAGQVVETWDANLTKVTRASRYDEAGRLVYVTTDPATLEGIEYVYSPGDLGRVSEVHEVTYVNGTANVKLVARNHYDLPMGGLSEYAHVAGKLSWTENDDTQLAYGYDDAGRLERRDQWFAILNTPTTKYRFTVSSDYGSDGRVTESRVVSTTGAGSTLTYNVDYDSAGHPVALSGTLNGSPRSQFYRAATIGIYGAYDAQGRTPVMTADDGKVSSARMYNQYSGALEGECKRFGAGTACTGTAVDVMRDIYRTDRIPISYVGTNLKSYTDSLTQTLYENAYLPSGRLQSAKATPQGSVQTFTQDWLEAFAFNGIGNIDTVTADRNVASGSTRPKRHEDVAYKPESPSTGLALDRVATITSTTKDAAGAMTTDVAASTTSYSYDLLGHLTQVTRSTGESERLVYAPGGELLYRQLGEKFVMYLGEYATVTASGSLGCGSACVPQAATAEVDAHVIFAGTRIASVKPTRTLFYYRTTLGSVIATSLSGGVAGATYRYTPYGKLDIVSESDSTRSELGYTNALRLSGSLLYLKARVYDASARIFIQPDQVDRLRYAYAAGDPVNRSDPSGLLSAQDGVSQTQGTDAQSVFTWEAPVWYGSQPGAAQPGDYVQPGAQLRAESAGQQQHGVGLNWDAAASFVAGAVGGFLEGIVAPIANPNIGNKDFADGRKLGMKLGSGLVSVAGAGLAVVGVVTGPGEAALAPVGALAAAKGAATWGYADTVKADPNILSSRGKNKIQPNSDAEGAHSTFKTGPDGKVTNYVEYEPNSQNPSGFQEVKRVDLVGKPHANPDGSIVPTPHVKVAGEKGVRPALPSERAP